MNESSPQQEKSKGPEGVYTREAAIKRINNLIHPTSHDGNYFESALAVLGESVETLENMIASEEYLSNDNVGSFVKDLAIQIQEYKLVDASGIEGVTNKKAAAKVLCTFLKSRIDF